jgi:hypothetical protein
MAGSKAKWDIRAAIDGEEIMLTNISARLGKVGTTALQLARRIANATHGKGHGKDVQVIAYQMSEKQGSKAKTKTPAKLPPPKPPVVIQQVLTPAVLEAAFNYTTSDEETKDESSTPDSD